MRTGFAKTPSPPYWLVSFTSQRNEVGAEAYGEAAERMIALAATQPGFLGVESVRGEDGFGITLSYWADEASIAAWRMHAEHTPVREYGRAHWYDHFEVRVAKVERAYGFRDTR